LAVRQTLNLLFKHEEEMRKVEPKAAALGARKNRSQSARKQTVEAGESCR
jgi:hypothetical protein